MKTLLATLVLATATTAALAQNRIEIIEMIGDMPPGFVLPDGMPVPGAEAADGETPAEESERLKRLKALTYDRRPSSILTMWSTPVDEEEPRLTALEWLQKPIELDEPEEDATAEGEAGAEGEQDAATPSDSASAAGG